MGNLITSYDKQLEDAIYRRDSTKVQYLIGKGVVITQKNLDNLTEIDPECLDSVIENVLQYGHSSVVKILVDKVDKSMITQDCMDIAINYNSLETIKILVEKLGGYVFPSTYIEIAVRRDKSDIVKYLLQQNKEIVLNEECANYIRKNIAVVVAKNYKFINNQIAELLY